MSVFGKNWIICRGTPTLYFVTDKFTILLVFFGEEERGGGASR